MKVIFTVIFIFLSFLKGTAQGKSADSLKAVLANTESGVDQFDIIVKIETEKFNRGIGNFDSSNCMRLLDIAQKLNSDSLLAISYNFIANFLQNSKGDYTSAFDYLFKAIPLAEKVKDKRRVSSLYIDIAWGYYQLQNYEEALKYTRLGGNNLPGKSSPMYDYMLRQYQDNMVICLVALHQPDSALHYAQALNETNLRLKSTNYEAAALLDFAMLYEAKGDNETAAFYFKRANNMTASMTWYSTVFPIKFRYTNFLLKEGKMADAKAMSLELLQLGQQIQNNDMKRAAAGFLTRVYESAHEIDSAFFYSKMESTINKSIFNQDNTNKIQALAFNEKIRNMEEADRLADEEERRQQNIQFILVGIGIIGFVIGFLLFTRSLVANEKLIGFFSVLALLIVFEFLNLLLHPFLERVTHHTPLLMLLALVCIAALLVPLHHKLEKWATANLVEKNKKIRLAAARKIIERLEEKPRNLGS